MQVTPSIKFPADQKSSGAIWHREAWILLSLTITPYQGGKGKGWENIWLVEGGIPGIETRVPYLLNTGVLQKRFTLNDFADIIATKPAKIFGLYPQKGALRWSRCRHRDLGPEKEYEVDPATWGHQADWTPFAGMKWKGDPVLTILRAK